MKRPRKDDYFWNYSQKWERAVKDRQYHDALLTAIRSYLVSKDLGNQAFETASLVYMTKAIESLRIQSREQESKLSKKQLACSFCGKTQKEVRLVAGPNANICNKCVTRLHGVLKSHGKGKGKGQRKAKQHK